MGVGATFIALAGGIALLYYGRVFLITLSTAIILAFILEPLVGLLMRLRLPRSLASFFVCSFAICVIYLMGLGVYTHASGLADDMPIYRQRISDLTDQALQRIEAMEKSIIETVVPKRFREQPAPPPPAPKPVTTRARPRTPAPLPVPEPAAQVQEVRIRPERPPLIDFIYEHLGSFYELVLMVSFVPFLVYFMLSWSEHIHRRFLQLFDDDARLVAGRAVDGIASMVRAFVVGNFVLGILLAAASSGLFWAFNLPYPLLIGPLSGIVSLVPYIGLPLAMLPPFFAALALYHTMAPYLIILTLVALVHLLAMNLLYPKIVGPRVHLNPLVVTIALMFWSVIWGAAGLILAIPMTAGIKAVCDNVDRLQPYGRLLGD